MQLIKVHIKGARLKREREETEQNRGLQWWVIADERASQAVDRVLLLQDGFDHGFDTQSAKLEKCPDVGRINNGRSGRGLEVTLDVAQLV